MTTIIGMQYMTDFSCRGSRCGSNCCSGAWKIPYDESDYTELERVFANSGIIRPDIRDAFTMDVPRGYYAFIRMDSNGRCPFLTPDKLCGIHAHYGQEAIGTICRTFPRIINTLGDRAEVSGDLSCAEVARLLFQSRQPIAFMTMSRDALPPGRLHIEKEIRTEEVVLVDTLRECLIRLLSLPSYSLMSRLFFLASFCEKIGALNTSDYDAAADGIRGKFNHFAEKANLERLDKVIGNIDVNTSWPLNLVTNILRERTMRDDSECNEWIQNHDLSRDGINHRTDAFLKWQREAGDASRNNLDNFITVYLCHRVATKLPEWKDGLFAYARAVITNAMLAKFMVVTGAACISDPPSPLNIGAPVNTYVNAICKFTKHIEHDLQYEKTMNSHFAQLRVESLAHLLSILKCMA